MKLIDKLDPRPKRELIDFFTSKRVHISMKDVNRLDDFLADQGFEINPTAFGPDWIYTYENSDEVVIHYAKGVEKWSLYFEGHDPNLISTEEHFNSIDELIDYLQG